MFKFIKIRDVKSPNRAHSSDSGIDFFIPNDLKVWDIKTDQENVTLPIYNNEKWDYFKIPPNMGALIPSWIKWIISKWYDLVFENKSWVATKYLLTIWAKVVDSSYRWQIHIHLINNWQLSQMIYLWQKVAQWIIRKVENFIPEEITEDEFLENCDTDRWEWWFGSTWEK